MTNDLYTPKKKVMPEVPGMRLVQHNYHDIGLLDGSFVDKLYISVVEQIDDAIVAECVKIAHEAGIGQHILLNKKFIVDAIQEKLEAQQVINDARPVDAEVVRHGRWYQKRMSVPKGKGQTYLVWACSLCHKHEKKRSDYCPNCGAKMGGKEDAAD